MLKKLSLLVIYATSVLAMHSAEININNKDLEISAGIDLGQYNSRVEPDTTFLGFSYIKGADENSERSDGEEASVNGYFELNFLMKKEVKDSGFDVGIGVKTNYTNMSNKSFVTIPLGLEASYVLPIEIPVTVGAMVYYAPESLASADADSFLEYRGYVNAEIIQNGSLVLGFRNLNTNYNIDDKRYDVTYNKSVYFGFKFDF